ncbi:MAG: chemotaxis protein CheW [Nitrospinota bacterium]|nr:chemotaxis protein CheW [Nitrospinota bacterium]
MAKASEDMVLDDIFDEDEDTQKDMYLTFQIQEEVYGIEIRYVTEIIGLQKITAVPDMPDFIKGMINLRGKVIPVMDVRTRFSLPFREYDNRSCIIVVNMSDNSAGLIVDRVREVVNIPESEIEPAPRMQKQRKSMYVQGMGKVGDEVKILLDVNKLLEEEELELVGSIAEEPNKDKTGK